MSENRNGTAGPRPRGSAPLAGAPAAQSVLQRIAQGDPSAVADCLSLYGDLVWSLVRRSLPNPSDAEDLVQDIFIAIWKNAHKFDANMASELTFVAMIARRRLIDRLRKDRSAPVAGPLPSNLSAAARPFAIDRADDVARASEALGRLREEEQAVLTHSLHHGFTYEQIARVLKMPLGTVKTHARRGLIRLRELMQASAPKEVRP